MSLFWVSDWKVQITTLTRCLVKTTLPRKLFNCLTFDIWINYLNSLLHFQLENGHDWFWTMSLSACEYISTGSSECISMWTFFKWFNWANLLNWTYFNRFNWTYLNRFKWIYFNWFKWIYFNWFKCWRCRSDLR